MLTKFADVQVGTDFTYPWFKTFTKGVCPNTQRMGAFLHVNGKPYQWFWLAPSDEVEINSTR
jgi:hypothetical protein